MSWVHTVLGAARRLGVNPLAFRIRLGDPSALLARFDPWLEWLVSGWMLLFLAALITQVPLIEKIITPYILLLVTTPMIALVPLLILIYGFTLTPRIIAVALAVAAMISATGSPTTPPGPTGRWATSMSTGSTSRNTCATPTPSRPPVA